jgi:hypothetical protein
MEAIHHKRGGKYRDARAIDHRFARPLIRHNGFQTPMNKDVLFKQVGDKLGWPVNIEGITRRSISDAIRNMSHKVA